MCRYGQRFIDRKEHTGGRRTRRYMRAATMPRRQPLGRCNYRLHPLRSILGRGATGQPDQDIRSWSVAAQQSLSMSTGMAFLRMPRTRLDSVPSAPSGRAARTLRMSGRTERHTGIAQCRTARHAAGRLLSTPRRSAKKCNSPRHVCGARSDRNTAAPSVAYLGVAAGNGCETARGYCTAAVREPAAAEPTRTWPIQIAAAPGRQAAACVAVQLAL